MKKITLFILAIFVSINIFAQSNVPQSVAFSSVVRDANNQLVVNTAVSIRLTFKEGGQNGDIVYCAMHNAETNQNGFVSLQLNRDILEVGCNGATITEFENIPWANGEYWLEVEYQIAPETDFVSLGQLEIASSFYAFVAGTAERVASIEIDGAQNGDVLVYNSTSGKFEPVHSNLVCLEWDNIQYKPNFADVATSGNYEDLSNTPILSSVAISGSYNDLSDTPNLFSGNYEDLSNKPIIPAVPTNVSEFTNDAGYLTEYTEIDPEFTAWDKSTGISIAESQISDLGNYIETETQNLADVIAINNSANSQIKNLTDPTEAQDAATKAYVDELKIMILDLQAELGVTDSRDGYHYNAVRIGSQVWMAENLRYLPTVVGPGTGSNTDPYYYVYGYDGTNVNDAKATTNYQTYGVLYNWTAAQTACPTGWHLPTDAEWTELTDFVGGAENAGTLLKSQNGWYDNGNGTDQYGFTALPGGYRGGNGSFSNIGNYGSWWSASEDDAGNAWYRNMYYSVSNVSRSDFSKEYGFSVRCVRD